MIETIEELHAHERAARETILLRKIYVDITGDLIAGLLLSQIFYWNLKNDDGDIRAAIVKDGKRWVAKRREDWWNEVRISQKQFDRAKNILVGMNLIEAKTYKFNGSPTVHIWLNQERLLELYNEEIGKSILPKGEDGYSPKGKNDIDERVISLTETTTETTTEINNFTQEWKKQFPKKPQPRESNKKLCTKLKARLESSDFKKQWKQALYNASLSPYLQDSGWFGYEWFLRNDENWRRVLNFEWDWKDQQDYKRKGSESVPSPKADNSKLIEELRKAKGING